MFFPLGIDGKFVKSVAALSVEYADGDTSRFSSLVDGNVVE